MWLKENRLQLSDIQVKQRVPSHIDNFTAFARTFGYSKDDMFEIIQPMAEGAAEPTNSMGNDTPISVFSEKPKLFTIISGRYLHRLPILRSTPSAKDW
jgi:glutamate synthase (NADPH) large chain